MSHLKNIFANNRALEALREELALRPDFNCTELFEMIGRERLFVQNVQDFALLIGASITREEAVFLIH